MKTIHLFLIILFCFSWNTAYPQPHPETGLPFIRNYTPGEYGAYSENWAIVQDHRGVMYFGNGNDFGNGNGVLEYDGVSWRLIPVPNKTTIRSLAIDENDRIYVGAVGDLGYLEPDANGQMHFISLSDQINDENRAFGDVWETFVASENVYFNTDRLFRWNGNQFKVWNPVPQFHASYVVRDTFYIRQWEVGLLRMEGDTLKLLPGGERFAKERIYAMLPLDENRILIGTRTEGLFIFDGHSIQPFGTEADGFLKTNHLYCGIALKDGTIALGTLVGGLAIIDREGRFLQHIDKSAGLQNNSVLFLYQDYQDALWLALSNGISRIEISSPLSVFDARTGIETGIQSILRFKGNLYVASGFGGVFYLDALQKTFRLVPGITATESWKMLSFRDRLLVAALTGVFEIRNNRAYFIRESVSYDYRAFTLYRSHRNSNHIFVGLESGLAALRFSNNTWIDEGIIPGVDENIQSIVENEEGSLWLGTNAMGVLRVDFDSGDLMQPSEIKRFGYNDGLPKGGVSVFEIAGKIYFGTNSGLFRFDNTSGSFLPDSTFTGITLNGSSGDYTLRQDNRGNVWLNFGAESAVALRDEVGNNYRIEKTPFLRFADFRIHEIYPEEDGIIWFGGPNGIIRYDSNREKSYTADFSALIRRVTAGEDSVIFGGTEIFPTVEGNLPPENSNLPQPMLANPNNDAGKTGIKSLSHTYNTLRFEYAAPNYDNEAANQFQYFLEGFDRSWSTWSNEAKRDYTNLPSGKYHFRVRARNLYHYTGNEAVYSFSILPPWWRTWWAYGGYILVLGMFVYTFDRIQRRRLIRRERQRAELLGQIGKNITASLDSDTIFYNLYENVNQLLDATIFGVGIYHPERKEIEYRLAIEKGKRYKPYTRDMSNKNQFPVWCIENRQPVFINDVSREYRHYIEKFDSANTEETLLEDGTFPEEPQSLIYLPLIAKEKVLGIISVQSFQKNAYTLYHLNILQNLAAYTTIALDNANAYRQLNTLLENLEKTVEERTAEIQKQKNNIEQLSEIGKEITASLDIDTIFFKLYEHVNRVVDATVFGVGVYHPDKSEIEYRLAIEKGKLYAPYTRDTNNKNQFPVWSIENREPVFINDVENEYRNYIEEYIHLGGKLEDGTVSENPSSMIYLPLISQERVLGVITVQSFQKNAYTDYHLNLLQNLAAYTSIALDNADAYRKLNATLENIKAMQQQLVTQEKLASLGQLTAGIAHEIKNPLNFVNNFAELSIELIKEVREDMEKLKQKLNASELENLEELFNDLEQNARKINEHGRRADSIVRSMLQHSRGKKGERQPTDLNAMLEEDLNLAYHGMRAQDSSFNVTIEKEFDITVGKLNIVPQDVSRVFLNIISNGFFEVHKKKIERNGDFSPRLRVASQNLGDRIEVRIRDNGNGIPPAIQDKLFNPFFTTKPTGQGTGLGLSISYEIIVQEHKGEITFETREGEFTEFIISIPNN